MNTSLARVAELVRLYRSQQHIVDDLEERLAAAKEVFRRLEREDLPLLMQEVGLSEVTLDDELGTKVVVKDDVEASVSEERMPAAVAWLAERGFAGIVKTEVALRFDRGERERAEELAGELREHGLEPTVRQTINPQTLKAFVRERMAAGETVPFDLFGIQPFSRARLSTKRK